MEAEDIQKFYLKVIKDLQKLYFENAQEDKIWNRFQQEIKKKFKLDITFDFNFTEAFNKYFKSINDNKSSEIYISLLKWTLELNNLVYEHKFISYREFQKHDEKIKEMERAPSNLWLRSLNYLKAEDINEFRFDFMTRFCNVPDGEAEELAESADNPQSLERIKANYVKFFQGFFKEGVDCRIATFIESEWSTKENKGEMLPKDLIVRMQKLLGAEVGREQNEMAVNKMLVEIAQMNLYQNDRDMQQQLEGEVDLIKKALEKFSGLDVIKKKSLTLRLAKFGSLTSGFAGIDADLDLTILTNCYVNELEFLTLLYQFLKKDYQEGDRRTRGRRVIPELIRNAKTPLISIRIAETGKTEIKIDIIVNNVLGVINSRFLAVYAGVKWVKNLGILVKLWGKSVKLIDKSYFSSYAMILMLIHYLIKIKAVRPLLDARTRSKQSPHFTFKRRKLNQDEVFDVYYCFLQESSSVASSERCNYLAILTGFMKYYALDLWKEKEEMRIITVDQSREKAIDNDCVITIKDPFDEPHNPGRLKIEHKEFMILRFKEAHQRLTQKDKIDNIRDLFGSS